jgi:hypothetical protein
MTNFSKSGDKISKIFNILLVVSIISLVIIAYSMEVEQHVSIIEQRLALSYLKHTFNQSATNFDVLNESRYIHSEQIKHELQITNDTNHINSMLTQINHTMFDIVLNGHR